MTLNVKEYIGNLRDSKAETQLVKQLRNLEPDEIFDFISEYLDHDQVVGLELAKRSIRRRRDFERLLQRGFHEADAYSIRFWLDCCVDRIGARRSMNLLRETVMNDAEAGRRIMYSSRLVLLRAMPDLREELDELALHIGMVGNEYES